MFSIYKEKRTSNWEMLAKVKDLIDAKFNNKVDDNEDTDMLRKAFENLRNFRWNQFLKERDINRADKHMNQQEKRAAYNKVYIIIFRFSRYFHVHTQKICDTRLGIHF